MIRRASLQDLSVIAEIEAECFGRDAYPRSLLKWLLVSPNAVALVAEEGGEVVGFAAAAFTPSAATIYTVDVRPGKRRRGIGTRLLSALEKELAKAGVASATLQVEVSNAPAILLYEKLGYKADGAAPNYYGPGRDALIMSKRLRA